MSRVFVDAQSAGGRRITGWERYARSIVAALIRDPWASVISIDTDSVPLRLALGATLVPIQSRKAEIAHYLTYPPVHIASKTIVTLHDLTWWKHPEYASRLGLNLYKPLMERALRRTYVATVSKAMATEISAHFDIEEPAVIYPTVDVSRYVQIRPYRSAKPYILTIGTIEPRKNLTGLVTAYMSSNIRHDYDLIVAGRIAWGTLPDDVIHMDTPSDPALAALVKGAAAVVSAAFHEGFGLPLVESQSVGVPVLCSDIPVFREVTGGHAQYFDPRSQMQIISALNNVSSISVSDDARINAERFSLQNMRESLVRLYRRIDPSLGC